MVVTFAGGQAAARLANEISQCRLCREAPLGGARACLPHEPNPIAVVSSQARILIASQAPGLRAHKSGLPFYDASGDRLRYWLGVDCDVFYDPQNFAILPMGFCFPGYDASGGDLPPRRECTPQWREKALAVMPQIKLVLVIGSYAQAWHLPTAVRRSMTQTVADWRNILDHHGTPATLPLPHPSWRNSGWLKRNPFFEAELLPVLRERIKLLIS